MAFSMNIRPETVRFEKFYFGATGAVSKHVLEDLQSAHRDQPLRMSAIYEDISPVYDQLLITIRGFLLKGMHTEKRTLSVEVPATWADHLKDSMLKSGKRWQVWLAGLMAPPEYRTVTKEFDAVTRVCPHNNTYFPESQQHMNFLLWRNDNDQDDHPRSGPPSPRL